MTVKAWIAAAAVVVTLGGGVFAWWSYEHHVPGLDAARARWHALGWHDYSFEYRNGCFCERVDVVVTVRRSRIISVVSSTRSITTIGSYWRSQAAHPIDWFFNRIGDAVAGADSYRVTFDPRTGVPVDFSVDPSKSTMDDEWSWSITNLERLR